MISFVYAQEAKGGIGYQGGLPWSLPSDLQFFKKTTMGHTMLMGRKTFEAMDQRLLPGRKTVVMTTQAGYGADIDGLEVVTSIEAVLELANDQNLMVIGGAEIFKQIWPYADVIIRTVIADDFPVDVFMPEIDEAQWECYQVEEGELDEANVHPHQYQWWRRKNA